MPAPKFSIGIDLGTTNCALSYVELDSAEARSRVFSIAQWESTATLAESDTLPSFLYLPDESESGQFQAGSTSGGADWICGRFARKRAAEVPGRVAHSAKSWLGHHAVDCGTGFLPWGTGEISHDRKISPIRASALLLNYLRGAWNQHFTAHGAGFQFDDQAITITVPASFDAFAQQLTLAAAADAGFPPNVRLLEEPQAAFYRWLEEHAGQSILWSHLPDGGGTVLVIDIGGGTSDFSLFEISRQAGTSEPAIRRVAVSEHLLLGGDNIDLAIARQLEPRLADGNTPLAGGQWQELVARCRDLKEHCLAGTGGPEEEFTLSLPGRGTSLFAGAVSTRVTRGEILGLLHDGFFPDCPPDAQPAEADAALKEWGLPYAADSAVTRYLAAFLRDLPAVDALLFNGGSLYPESLRSRLQRQIGAWQDGRLPRVLQNPDPGLAVARGAACFGAILHHRRMRIESGAARSIYLEVLQAESKSLVCILPRGAPAEEVFRIRPPGLELRVNRPVRFQIYQSTRHDKHRIGELVSLSGEAFHKLPPVQSTARLDGGGAIGKIPVHLTARLTELGLLHLECVSADPAVDQSWPLAFNLRADAPGGMPMGDMDLGVEAKNLAAAKDRITSIFGRHLDAADPLTAARLQKSLEGLLGLPKHEWNLKLLRALWGTLKRCIPCRRNSAAHEEAWLILAGYFLRPGFGAELDPGRMDDLWKVHTDGLIHPAKQVQLQQHILWRRLAGGLDRARQQSIIDAELPRLRQQKSPAAELVRLAGALERIDARTKEELVTIFLHKAVPLAAAGGYAAPYLVSLGLLLNRTPLFAGPESVVSQDLVARAYDALQDLDWQSPELAELFLRAGRVTGNRDLDLPAPLREKIARKLGRAGVPGVKVQRLEKCIPVSRADQTGLYGESLPPGLTLGAEE